MKMVMMVMAVMMMMMAVIYNGDNVEVAKQVSHLLDKFYVRHVPRCFGVRSVGSQFKPGLGNLEGRLLRSDGVLDVVDVLAQVVHLLQVQGEVGLQLAVHLAALSDPESFVSLEIFGGMEAACLVVKAWLVAFQDSSIAFAALARWCSTWLSSSCSWS